MRTHRFALVFVIKMVQALKKIWLKLSNGIEKRQNKEAQALNACLANVIVKAMALNKTRRKGLDGCINPLNRDLKELNMFSKNTVWTKLKSNFYASFILIRHRI